MWTINVDPLLVAVTRLTGYREMNLTHQYALEGDHIFRTKSCRENHQRSVHFIWTRHEPHYIDCTLYNLHYLDCPSSGFAVFEYSAIIVFLWCKYFPMSIKLSEGLVSNVSLVKSNSFRPFFRQFLPRWLYMNRIYNGLTYTEYLRYGMWNIAEEIHYYKNRIHKWSHS